MKINEVKTRKRLENIDLQNRVFIYDGTLILEFLRETFVNPKEFVDMPEDILEYGRDQFKDQENFKGLGMFKEQIYDLYLEWRDIKDYTTAIENRYRFFLILGKLTFRRNGWQFTKYRTGTDQSICFTPMKQLLEATNEEILMSVEETTKTRDTYIETTPADQMQDGSEIPSA